jgi:hypothetical protein
MQNTHIDAVTAKVFAEAGATGILITGTNKEALNETKTVVQTARTYLGT